MSRTDHSKGKRRATKIRREGSNRAALRQTLHQGNFDELPTTMPTRIIRTTSRTA